MNEHDADAIGGDRWAFTPREVAVLLGVGRDAVYRGIKDGSLPTVRVGSRKVVPADALRDRLAAAIPATTERRPA